MKGLTLVALVGFVLAIALAIPFSEDGIEADGAGMKQIGNDMTQR